MIVAKARIAFPHEVANTPSDRRRVKVLGGFVRAWHAAGMAISKARVRKLALGLKGASEVVHMDRPAFRTTRKIFATVPPDAQAVNLMFDLAT